MITSEEECNAHFGWHHRVGGVALSGWWQAL